MQKWLFVNRSISILCGFYILIETLVMCHTISGPLSTGEIYHTVKFVIMCWGELAHLLLSFLVGWRWPSKR